MNRIPDLGFMPENVQPVLRFPHGVATYRDKLVHVRFWALRVLFGQNEGETVLIGCPLDVRAVTNVCLCVERHAWQALGFKS